MHIVVCVIKDKLEVAHQSMRCTVHVLDHYRKLYKYVQSLVGNVVCKCTDGPLIE